MDVKLIVVNGKVNRKEIPIQLPLTIGRGKEAGLTVAHPTVSRIHCELYELDGALVVRDNNSTNGIYIGEHQVSMAVLRPGDELTVGPLTFQADYDHPGDDYPSLGGEEAGNVATEEDAGGMDFFGSLNVETPATEPEVPDFEAEDAGEAGVDEDLEATAQFDPNAAAALNAAIKSTEEVVEEEAEVEAESSETFQNEAAEELEFELNTEASAAETEEPQEEEVAESTEASEEEAEFDFLADAPAAGKKAPSAKGSPPPEEPLVSEKPSAKSAKPAKDEKKGWWPFGGKKGEKPAAKAASPAAKPAKKVEPVVPVEPEASEQAEEALDFEVDETQAPETSAEEPASGDSDDGLNDFFNQMGLK